ncbi:MAG TPA: tetratricopeptide repeat protein [Steroidobacteraceae bacterium]|jgi:TolB-like protein/DNA-binding winged helix-turn-helix (wHTH) protein/Flp pilus assembly protein TadD
MDKRVIRFDGWKVDFASGEISKDGATHRLQDQPLQILDELVKQPGVVVTREQLIARLWPKGVVEFDTGLNSAMRKLRSALGDDPETPRYIETLPRKGYRFIAKLEDASGDTVPSLPRLPSEYQPTSFETGAAIGRRASDRRAPYKRLAWGFGSILAALVLTVVAWRMPGKLFEGGLSANDLPTIVVLPLVDMSVAQSEQSLCDGLTDELSNWLAHIPTLRVVARTSAFAFKGKDKDVREIASTLGATHVLEGSLRRSRDQLRITMQLIDAVTGLHIWSDSYDLPMGDIFQIEDTVSRSVAENLHLELTPAVDEQWAERRAETTNAFELYLLGLERQRQRTAEDNLKALQFFRRAVDADPRFTPALTGLAETLLNGLSLNRMPLEDVKAEVEPLINRALQLRPNSPRVLAVKGWLLTEEFRIDEALPLLQRAIEGNPNDASLHRYLGNLYDRRGQPSEALQHFSAAAKLDPLDFISHVFRCMELTDVGRFGEARDACQRARQLDPANMWGPLTTSWIERAQGNTTEALRWIDEARKREPANSWLADQKIDLLFTLGRTAEARDVMKALPQDGSFFSKAREGSIVFAEGGPTALADWLAASKVLDFAGTGAELVEAARLQLLSGNAKAAHATLAHAEHLLPLSAADAYDGSQIRHEYSAALNQARIELLAGGDRARAMQQLALVAKLLDTYEKSGGRHYGLYAIRSEVYALRGDKDKAAAELRKAWEHGWRSSWRARHDPFLAGVDIPGLQ